MGTSRDESVVDGECRVHGYENLFVGGSSVFPSGGYANPTLTIVALALRMADTTASTSCTMTPRFSRRTLFGIAAAGTAAAAVGVSPS